MDMKEQDVQPDTQAGMQLTGTHRLFPCLLPSPQGPQETQTAAIPARLGHTGDPKPWSSIELYAAKLFFVWA